MADQSEQLCNFLGRQQALKPAGADKLGDVVKRLVEREISPRQEKFGPVKEFWEQLLPAELASHCRIVEVESGQMKVLVDSPVYLYELRLCSSELLARLQQQCPRAGVRRIKFVSG